MTSVARKQPTFGRRGNGPPQKSRIVASVPVTRLSAPLAKAPEKSVPKPSRIWTAPAAFFKACTTASAKAYARLSVAAASAVQNGKSAVADFRAARELSKAQAEMAKLSSAQAVESAAVQLLPRSGSAQGLDGTSPSVAAPSTVLLPTLPDFDFVAELVAADPVPQAEAVAFAENFAEPEPTTQEFRSKVAEAVPPPTALNLVSPVEASEIVVEEPVSDGGHDLPSAEPAFKAGLDVAIVHVPAAFVIADADHTYVDEAVFDQAFEPAIAVQAFEADRYTGSDPAPVSEAEETSVAEPEVFEPAVAVLELKTGNDPAPATQIAETSVEEPEAFQPVSAVHELEVELAAGSDPVPVAKVAETSAEEPVFPAAFERSSATQRCEAEPDAGIDAAAEAPQDIMIDQLDEPAISRDADVLTLDAPRTWTAPAVPAPASVVTFPTKLPLPEDFADEASTQFELFDLEGEASSVAHVNTSDDWIWGRAYFLACAVAFPTAVGLMCKFGGPADPMTGLGPVAQVFVAAVSPLLGFVFFLPALALVKLARVIRIPRGFRDVLTGGLLGSSWLLLALYDGVTPPLAAYCLLADGLLGGLIFWLANRHTWRRSPV